MDAKFLLKHGRTCGPYYSLCRDSRHGKSRLIRSSFVVVLDDVQEAYWLTLYQLVDGIHD